MPLSSYENGASGIVLILMVAFWWITVQTLGEASLMEVVDNSMASCERAACRQSRAGGGHSLRLGFGSGMCVDC